MSLKYNKNLIVNARTLRSNMTRHERHLWYDFLNHYPIRVQRQKTIGIYIVDFYCAKAGIVIELDGCQHYTEEMKSADQKRDDYLRTVGLEILRFSNADIDRHFKSVCQSIDQSIQVRLTERNK